MKRVNETSAKKIARDLGALHITRTLLAGFEEIWKSWLSEYMKEANLKEYDDGFGFVWQRYQSGLLKRHHAETYKRRKA